MKLAELLLAVDLLRAVELAEVLFASDVGVGVGVTEVELPSTVVLRAVAVPSAVAFTRGVGVGGGGVESGGVSIDCGVH